MGAEASHQKRAGNVSHRVHLLLEESRDIIRQKKEKEREREKEKGAAYCRRRKERHMMTFYLMCHNIDSKEKRETAAQVEKLMGNQSGGANHFVLCWLPAQDRLSLSLKCVRVCVQIWGPSLSLSSISLCFTLPSSWSQQGVELRIEMIYNTAEGKKNTWPRHGKTFIPFFAPEQPRLGTLSKKGKKREALVRFWMRIYVTNDIYIA